MKYLTLNELREKLGGRGRTTIYRDVEARRCPQPIRLGGRLYWRESDVDDAMSPPPDRPERIGQGRRK